MENMQVRQEKRREEEGWHGARRQREREKELM